MKNTHICIHTHTPSNETFLSMCMEAFKFKPYVEKSSLETTRLHIMPPRQNPRPCCKCSFKMSIKGTTRCATFKCQHYCCKDCLLGEVGEGRICPCCYKRDAEAEALQKKQDLEALQKRREALEKAVEEYNNALEKFNTKDTEEQWQ